MRHSDGKLVKKINNYFNFLEFQEATQTIKVGIQKLDAMYVY